MDKKILSFTVGERLKALRLERNLSHEKLCKQMEYKYKISISRDSLIAYEIADETRAKASKLPNLGMRLEYLYCLADFFGVSLDYLVGKTDIKVPDCNIQFICKYTGLSEDSIETLRFLNYSLDGTYIIPTVDLLIRQEELPPENSLDFCYDVDNSSSDEDAEFIKEKEDWKRKQYIPILSIIENYLSLVPNPNSFYDLSATGEVLKSKNARGLKGVRLDSIRKIQSHDIIERVLLSDIEDNLKRLKAKLMENAPEEK